jgi:hypothetical protein
MTQITQTRILWVILVFCVLTPMVFPLGLPLGPSPEGDAAYDFIHGLPAGSIAMMVIEVAPSSAGELWPMALAIGRHHLSLGHKIVTTAFAPDGVMYAQLLREILEEEYGANYGEDIIILPYRAGGESALAAMADDIKGNFSEDEYGAKLAGFPLWQRIKNIKDIAVFSCYTAGDDHLWLARHVWGKYQVPCISGNIALSTPEAIVYYKNGQLVGLISGVKGAAHYEQKIGKPGSATMSMDAQSLGHAYLLILMILGNVIYWLQRKDMPVNSQGGS